MTLAEVITTTPYVPAWHETGTCMDRRHILCLHDVLVLTGMQRTLEIGTHTGASASAFIAAGIPDAHFCDPTTYQQALNVIGGRGTVHARKGCDVLADQPPFDMVLVDGAHDLVSVCEELMVLLKKPPAIIMAHDVSSTKAGFILCEGAAYLVDALKEDGWTCIIDDKYREGEMTHRGLLMATKDQRLADIMAAVAARICP